MAATSLTFTITDAKAGEVRVAVEQRREDPLGREQQDSPSPSGIAAVSSPTRIRSALLLPAVDGARRGIDGARDAPDVALRSKRGAPREERDAFLGTDGPHARPPP